MIVHAEAPLASTVTVGASGSRHATVRETKFVIVLPLALVMFVRVEERKSSVEVPLVTPRRRNWRLASLPSIVSLSTRVEPTTYCASGSTTELVSAVQRYTDPL